MVRELSRSRRSVEMVGFERLEGLEEDESDDVEIGVARRRRRTSGLRMVRTRAS